MLGYTPEELCRLGMKGLTFPDDIPASKELVNQLLEGTRSHGTLEKRYVKKDGSLMWAQTTVSSILDKQGNYLHSIALIQDITERKRADMALRASEERYHALYDGTPTMYFTLATDGRTLSVNRFGAEQLGYQVEELIGHSILGIFYEADKEVVAASLSECLTTPETTRRWELRKVRKNGDIIWVRETVRVGQSSTGETVVLVTGEDITERKQAEQELKFFRTLLDHVDDSIEIIDPQDGRFLDGNAKAASNLGYTRDELLVLTVPDIDPLVTGPIFSGLIQGLRDAPAPLVLDSIHRRKDGTTFPVEVSAQLIRLDREYLVAIVRDITERKQAQEALRESEQAIRALYEATAAPGLSFDERVQAVLEVGCRRFKLPIGMRTQVVSNKLELIQVWAPGTDFTVGMVVPLENTYCNTTLQETEPVGFEHAGVSAWQYHPGYKALGLESYIGTKLIGRDQVYGTVCFTGQNPLPTSFSQADKDFVQLMARWISGEMDRRMAEQALKDSEERYRALYDDTPTMYFTLAVDGTVRSVNRFGAEQLGYQAEELIGHSVLHVFHEQDKETVAASLSECLTTPETTRHWEFRKIRKDGTVIWVRETACVGQSSTGETVVLVTCEDTTERKRVEEELRQRERDLQTALQERERISQDLHDGILQSLFAVGLTLETAKSMMTPTTRKSSGPPLD